MSLMNLWRSSPDTIKSYAIRQIVAVAGDGRLRDASACSADLRSYLRETPSDKLASYANECLDDGFDGSGLVLQDVINEVGNRLEFGVEDGLYRGRPGAIGFDGIWRVDSNLAVIVEVKTTDTYNVRLDDVAMYREALIKEGRIPITASILFLVGRKDTGALEAQIRGSRFAWDMRVVGVDSLIKLMQIKEKSSEDTTVRQIRELLRPFEYTRIDRIVDVVFDTAADVEQATDEPKILVPDAHSDPENDQEVSTRTATSEIDTMRERIATALQIKYGTALVRRRRALYESSDSKLRACVSISKQYGREHQPYWYAFHPKWHEFLGSAEKGLVVLGCMDRDEAFAIPLPTFLEFIPKFNQTIRGDGTAYWHVVIKTLENGALAIYASRTGDTLPLAPFSLPLATGH